VELDLQMTVSIILDIPSASVIRMMDDGDFLSSDDS
jgi:hypothetical protein